MQEWLSCEAAADFSDTAGGGMRALHLWVQDQIPHCYLSLLCCFLKCHCASFWLKAARMSPWHLPGLRERDNSLKFLLAALGVGGRVLHIATVTVPATLCCNTEMAVFPAQVQLPMVIPSAQEPV